MPEGTTENPYAPPQAADASQATADRGGTLLSLAKPVFLAWEKLRVVYVLLLGAVTLATFAGPWTDPKAIAFVVKGAILANLCYFAGPLTETYVRFLGYDRPWVRWGLFASGTILAILLAITAITFREVLD